ncbi:MAG: phosphatidylglycerophosphatase A [Acinetobacter sp.]|nr:phosphatidylglycerophosphatase A [Acinetobacter sp.]
MSNHKPDVRKSNPCPPCPKTATPFEKCIYWLGIGLGSGLPKRAAGTWGTLGGLIVALPMFYLGFWGFLAITIVATLVGSYICGKTSDLMNVHDDPHIVWDEWVGMWIALLPIVYLKPEAFHLNNTQILIAITLAFALFRFFDIIKPFPIKWVDKNVSGGFGILIDDVLAGIMAAVILYWALFLIFLYYFYTVHA